MIRRFLTSQAAQKFMKKRIPMAQKGRFSKKEKTPPDIHQILA